MNEYAEGQSGAITHPDTKKIRTNTLAQREARKDRRHHQRCRFLSLVATIVVVIWLTIIAVVAIFGAEVALTGRSFTHPHKHSSPEVCPDSVYGSTDFDAPTQAWINRCVDAGRTEVR
jgi:hypothetical protein